MTVSALSAAKALCELRDWSISNMALQKILYLAHMTHLGESGGEPLIHESFEAWDYGPVVPDVYGRAKAFGSEPVRNVFHWVDVVRRDSADYRSLAKASDETLGMTPGGLVAMTHWKKGAWAKVYKPGLRGIKMSNSDILREYRERRSTAI